MAYFDVEMTDTFSGEANYTWVERFRVKAKSASGAIRKVSRYLGLQGRIRKDADFGTLIRHNVTGAAICLFTTYAEDGNVVRSKTTIL